MSRKREKPYPSRHEPTSLAKRRRPPPESHADDGVSDRSDNRSSPPPAVVVIGLSSGCSVLDLKSRFEIYGSISRIRIDRDGVGNITFRSKESADSAIAAALDPSFGITVDSKRVFSLSLSFSLFICMFDIGDAKIRVLLQVQVMWANDPLCQWRKGVAIEGGNKDSVPSSSSKLLRGEVPLRRHGRGNRLGSAIVNPRTENNSSYSSVLDVPFKGREIVAYDDIL